MALEFDNSDNASYLSKVAHPSFSSAGAVATAVPISMFCWFNPNAVPPILGTMITIIRDPPGFGGYHYFLLGLGPSSRGTKIVAAVGGAGLVFDEGASTASYALDTWQSAAAVFATNSSRIAYLNGVAGTEDTDLCEPDGLENTYIGTSTLVNFDEFAQGYSGCLAHCAVWSAALTQQNITDLHNGALPSAIQPSSLVWYLPLNDFPTAATAYKWDGAAVSQTTDAISHVGAGALDTCATSPSLGSDDVSTFNRIFGCS